MKKISYHLQKVFETLMPDNFRKNLSSSGPSLESVGVGCSPSWSSSPGTNFINPLWPWI